jgi:signal transduction histidine kinase
MVSLDRAQLKQAFLNIGKNSLEAMPEGGRLRISLERAGGGEKVGVTFHDTGVGIPGEQLDRIFEPFFTTKKRGFGMGLAVVQKIICGCGGSIVVSSTEGKGTKITVILPLKRTADEPRGELCAVE